MCLVLYHPKILLKLYSLYSVSLHSLSSSEVERDDWLEAISNAISEYTKKMITFISSRYHDEVSLGYCLVFSY